jgi:membrane dipeptidase
MEAQIKLSEREEERALEIYKEATVIEGLTSGFGGSEPMKPYFPTLLKSGVTSIHLTVPHPYDKFRQAVERIAEWDEVIEQTDGLLKVNSVDDIRRAKKEKKVGIIVGSQNSDIIEGDVRLLRIFKQLGLKFFQLAYYEQNYVGCGGYEGKDSGLSRFGIKVVEELNRLGMLIDLSHCSDKTTMDAIECSRDPVTITHSGPRTLVKHFRNKTDEAIQAMAEKGGVIGLIAWSKFLIPDKDVTPKLEDYLRSVEYVVNLVGVDHVGIGLDICPSWTNEIFLAWRKNYTELVDPHTFGTLWVDKLKDHGGMLEITRGLVSKGYSDKEIRKILGESWMRIFEKVWGR